MITDDFWDRVKEYIDAKTINLNASIKNTLDMYPWDAFKQWVDAGFPAAKGWTSGVYDTFTGIVTFSSDQGLGFVTDDLRGATGAQGAPGVGMNLLGSKPPAAIITLTAGAIGDAYTTTVDGTDSEGTASLIGDVYRATNTAIPSNWVNIGDIQGPDGSQGIPGPAGPAPVQSGENGKFLKTDGLDNTEPTWEIATTPDDYAAYDRGGTVKVRLDGNNLYISTTSLDA